MRIIILTLLFGVLSAVNAQSCANYLDCPGELWCCKTYDDDQNVISGTCVSATSDCCLGNITNENCDS